MGAPSLRHRPGCKTCISLIPTQTQQPEEAENRRPCRAALLLPFPEAGGLISSRDTQIQMVRDSFQAPRTCRKRSPEQFCLPARRKQLLPAAPTPFFFQAVPRSWRASLVRAGWFWWMDKFPVFIPFFFFFCVSGKRGAVQWKRPEVIFFFFFS